jgi:hypothetical protein
MRWVVTAGPQWLDWDMIGAGAGTFSGTFRVPPETESVNASGIVWRGPQRPERDCPHGRARPP